MNEIRKYSLQKFRDFASDELTPITDIQLAILKGHILVEYTLNCYLESISRLENSDFFKENFSFAEKISLAKHFGQLGSKDQNLIKELTILNKLRNEIAHTLKFSHKNMEELFSELNKKNKTHKYNDNEQSVIENFKVAIFFITGGVFACYKDKTDKLDLAQFIKENETQA